MSGLRGGRGEVRERGLAEPGPCLAYRPCLQALPLKPRGAAACPSQSFVPILVPYDEGDHNRRKGDGNGGGSAMASSTSDGSLEGPTGKYILSIAVMRTARLRKPPVGSPQYRTA